MPKQALPLRVFKTMPADWMNEGYRRALTRIRSAAGETSDGTALDIVIAVFEASSWVAAIAERRGLNGDAQVRGLRHVRDRLLHGAAAPMSFDQETATWRWDPSVNLPPPTPEDRPEPGRDSYERHLAGHPVVEAIDYFDDLIREGSSSQPPPPPD